MKKYLTINKATRRMIDEFKTFEEAKKAVESYEKQDKEHGVFNADFYGIIEK